MAISLVDGACVLLGVHATNGSSPTLNVSGTGARPIYKESGGGFSAITAGALQSGPNIYMFVYNASLSGWFVFSPPVVLVPSDLPSGIDAAKIADGSVSNTEFQYLNNVTSAIQTQLNARLPLAGGTMTGALGFGTSAATSGSTREIHTGGDPEDLIVNVPTGGNINSSVNGIVYVRHSVNGLVFPTQHTDVSLDYNVFRYGTDIYLRVANGGNLHIRAGSAATQVSLGGNGIQFPSTQTSVGGAFVQIYRDSNADLNINVADTNKIRFLENGGLCAEIGEFTSGYPALRLYQNGSAVNQVTIMNYDGHAYYDIGPASKNHVFRNSAGSLSCITIGSTKHSGVASIYNNGTAGSVVIEASGYGYAALQAGAIATAANAGFIVSEIGSIRDGAITSHVGMVTRASNGTWTNLYYLGSTHYGDFYIYSTLGDGHCRIPITGTTLGTVVDNAGGVTYVDSGAEASGNVAFRVSGGYLQINVGTGITANSKFGVKFDGGWN